MYIVLAFYRLSSVIPSIWGVIMFILFYINRKNSRSGPKLRILDRFQTPQNANKSVQQVCALNPIFPQPTNFHKSMMSKKSQTVKSWISDRNDFSYFWSTGHPDASYQVSSHLAQECRRSRLLKQLLTLHDGRRTTDIDWKNSRSGLKLRILDRFQTPQNANKWVQQVCALNPIFPNQPIFTNQWCLKNHKRSSLPKLTTSAHLLNAILW